MKLVFVSSTFKDMQFERDMIHSRIEPLVNARLASYGENIYFGDLRWGVNTSGLSEEESSRKVLDVCLTEIDNCKPYMIVLIGERYGWIPEGTLIHEAAVLKGMEDLQEDISVTQLEIEYGALLQPEYASRVMFYFRKLDTTGMTQEQLRAYGSESPLHAEKITALKEKIMATFPDQYREYTAVWNPETQAVEELDALEKQISEDLQAVLQEDILAFEAKPWQERNMEASENYFLTNGNVFQSFVASTPFFYRGTCAEKVTMFVYCDDRDDYHRKCYLSYLYCRQAECLPKEYLLPYIFGITDTSAGVNAFLQTLIYRYEDILGLSHSDCSDWEETGLMQKAVELEYTCLRQNSKCIQCFIENADEAFLDYLYRLEGYLKQAYGLGLRTVNDNAFYTTFLFVGFGGDTQIPALYPFTDNAVRVADQHITDKEQVLQYISAIVASSHKEMASVVAEALASKNDRFSLTYLQLVAERLLNLDPHDFLAINQTPGDQMEAINAYQIRLMESLPGTVEGVTLELMQEAAQRIDADLVANVLIALLGGTKSIREIEHRLTACGYAFDQLDFMITVKFLKNVIEDNCGYYSFKRNSASQAALEYVKQNGYLKHLNRYIDSLCQAEDAPEEAFLLSLLADDTQRMLNVYTWAVEQAEDPAAFTRRIAQIMNDGIYTQHQSAIILFLINLGANGDWFSSDIFGRMTVRPGKEQQETLLRFLLLVRNNFFKYLSTYPKLVEATFSVSIRYLLLVMEFRPQTFMSEYHSTELYLRINQISRHYADELHYVLLEYALAVNDPVQAAEILEQHPLESFDFGREDPYQAAYRATIFKAKVHYLYFSVAYSILGRENMAPYQLASDIYSHYFEYEADPEIAPHITARDKAILIKIHIGSQEAETFLDRVLLGFTARDYGELELQRACCNYWNYRFHIAQRDGFRNLPPVPDGCGGDKNRKLMRSIVQKRLSIHHSTALPADRELAIKDILIGLQYLYVTASGSENGAEAADWYLECFTTVLAENPEDALPAYDVFSAYYNCVMDVLTQERFDRMTGMVDILMEAEALLSKIVAFFVLYVLSRDEDFKNDCLSMIGAFADSGSMTAQAQYRLQEMLQLMDNL